jgi:amino acid transporter
MLWFAAPHIDDREMPLTRDAELPAAGAGDRLGRGVLNTSELVFMVMAAAAPMAVVVALMPMAFAFGNGEGVPGTYVGAMIAMLLFAVGYVQIIPHVRNAGAFYAYISASFGRTCGLAAAYVAAISYFALCCSTLGALAFFSAELCKRISGINIRWEFWAALSIAAVSYLAYRRITLAAKVLSIALGAEILLLGILDVAIAHYRGLGEFTAQPFRPSVVFAPGFGIAAIYAFNGLIGVEGTAIYQEEARDRTRTVPRATYLSVIGIGCFYVLTSWCLVVGVGPGAAIAGAARSDPGHFVVGQITDYLGNWGGDLLSWLVVTSSFAAVLALFNNGARYVYALSRDGVLPRALARTHARYQSPYVASGVLTLLLAVVIAFSSIAGLDPLLNISTALAGMGSVGLMALLATTALGIPVFFAKRGVWSIRCTVAPAISGCAISIATVLAVRNYSALTGVDSAVINNLPFALLGIAVVGGIQARWLLKQRPGTYQRIGSNRVE